MSNDSETKLVMCIKGSVFDLAVDLRNHSSSFLKYHTEILSSENGNALLIPRGFGHGFQALENDTQLIYLHDNVYNKEDERGIHHLEPLLDINWPMPIVNVSERDESFCFIDKQFKGYDFEV